MVAGLAQTSVALDTSQWDNLPSESFDTTTVRALYDEANIYLRFESQIPPKSTPEAAEKERFEVWLTPVTNLKISFKFGAGLRPDSRTQAARGMLEDMMNLNHDKFDTLWKAQWSHESRLDEATGRITVMMSIPRRIVLSAAETENPRWFVNFQRSNSAGTHAWSVSAGSTGMEDPRRSGELSLGGADPRTPRHPLKELREKSYRDTFAFPTEWKEQIASGRPITLTGWKFRPDPAEMGVREEWFKLTNQTDPGWAPMEVPSFWEETESIGKFLGDGWYLVTFHVPPPISPGSRLRLLFAGVDEQAWIYLNGKQVGEHSERSERKAYTALYEEPFIVDVPAEQLKTSGENVLCIRVHNQVGAGGIWRPVHAILPRADRQPLR